MKELTGGATIEDSAKIFTRILENKGTVAQNSAVMANSGLAIATGKSITFEEGISQARHSLESGNAFKRFKKFLKINS